MKIAIVQFKPEKYNIESNEERINSLMDQALISKASFILFPEMSFWGYGFEEMDSLYEKQMEVIKRLHEKVRNTDSTLLIGGIEKEKNEYFLAQYVINKTIRTYRKIHIGKREALHVSPGKSIKVFNDHTPFGIMVCYDTHFPELATEMAIKGAKIIFAPSAVPNDPVARIKTWKKYLTARAYDNRVHVIANNLIFGDKGGGAIAIDQNGDTIFENDTINEGIHYIDIEHKEYSGDSMRLRDFNAHRKPEVYKNIEIEK